MKIVQACGEHLLQIAHISQALSRPERLEHRNGFLCDATSQPHFSEFLNCDSFLVLLSRQQVIGFMLAAPITHPGLALERSLLGQSDWRTINSARPLSSNDLYVKRVAIAPNYQRRGLGRLLYSELTTKFPSHHIMAAIIESPHDNIASAKFHRELGFERAATFRSHDIFGFADYTAGIYLRSPGVLNSCLSEILSRDAA